VKTYIYRKHLREPIKPAIGVLIYIIGLYLVYATLIYLSISTFSKNDFFKDFTITLVGLIVLFLIVLGILYKFYFKKFKSMSIVVGKENLIYKEKNKNIAIAYKDVVEVEFPIIKFSRGSFKIKSKDKVIKIIIDVENVGELIKDIRAKIDKNNSNFQFDEIRFNDFYVTACYSDDSWQRIYEMIKFIPPFVAINIILAFIFSFLVYDQAIKLAITTIFLVWPVLALVISEIILFIKQFIDIKKNSFNARIRNHEFENKVLQRVILSFAILITICLVYFLKKY